MGKKVLLKTDIKREAGFLYYCGTSKDGTIFVGQVEAKRGGKKKSKKKIAKKTSKKK